MSRTATIVLALAVGLAAGIPLGGRLMRTSGESTAVAATTAFSAVPDAVGAQDISGPYEAVAGWPKDLSTLPGQTAGRMEEPGASFRPRPGASPAYLIGKPVYSAWQ